MRILATLGFWWKGQAVEAGDRLDVPDAFGRELIHMHKAVIAPVDAVVTEPAKPKKAAP
jgi:hypothetical protein